jgi:hypothetical protein
MVLPTRVNIINDSSERIKVKIDNDKDQKYDKITNIQPGGRFEVTGSVSGFGNYDVVIDIITNPPGPGNNERHGTFKFDNPALGKPYVKSDDFKYGEIQVLDVRNYTSGYIFDKNFIRFNSEYVRDKAFDEAFTDFAGSEDLKHPLKSYWGKAGKAASNLAMSRKDLIEKDQEAMDKIVREYYSEMPRPLFTIEAFMQDAGAKTWDLRITSDSFLPTASDITAIKI